MVTSGEDSVFCTVEEALELIRAGKMVLVVDDEHRENEGDLVVAGEKITPEIINFMATHGRGLICVPMEEADLCRVGLCRMVPMEQQDRYRTAFTISVDAREGITTGISAFDRAQTVKNSPTQSPPPPILSAPATCSPSKPFPAASCAARDTRKPPWIWPNWPD